MATAAVGDVAASVRHALAAGPEQAEPFRHWRLSAVLPPHVVAELCRLPLAPPRIGDTRGRRETNNATRSYVTPQARGSWPVAQAVGEAFQSRAVIDAIEDRCRLDLHDAFLRIEYCQDTDGFWLEPHTDIRVKRLTLLVYLSEPPAGEDWGTDLYNADLSPAGSAPCAPGRGLLFLPAGDTLHGFKRRPITGVRRSLIVNYVTSDWRAREELAFPDRPVA